MSSFWNNIQPVIKKETRRVAVSTAVCVVIMYIVFVVLHAAMPEKVPFDYTVILGGLAGGFVAVLNFFLMGLTVQGVAATEDEELARKKMKASYSQRMVLQMVWAIVAIAAPCFQSVAGIAPLLFPGIGIKFMGIIKK